MRLAYEDKRDLYCISIEWCNWWVPSISLRHTCMYEYSVVLLLFCGCDFETKQPTRKSFIQETKILSSWYTQCMVKMQLVYSGTKSWMLNCNCQFNKSIDHPHLYSFNNAPVAAVRVFLATQYDLSFIFALPVAEIINTVSSISHGDPYIARLVLFWTKATRYSMCIVLSDQLFYSHTTVNKRPVQVIRWCCLNSKLIISNNYITEIWKCRWYYGFGCAAAVSAAARQRLYRP